MSASILYMSMSLDGFIAGPNDTLDNPGGDGLDRLHEWIFNPVQIPGRVNVTWVTPLGDEVVSIW